MVGAFITFWLFVNIVEFSSLHTHHRPAMFIVGFVLPRPYSAA